jgi:hypothetical protein
MTRLLALSARVDRAIGAMLGRIPVRWRAPLGVAALAACVWVAMWGHVWGFERLDAHRFTAKAMLGGTLRVRAALTRAAIDEQIHDGAVYTNWGFGVPLLQMPFHALASVTGLARGFFPDRAIYFIYACPVLAFLWLAFDRLARGRGSDLPDVTRGLVSWTATVLAAILVLFPLTTTRLLVWEETLAYFVLTQFVALAAYVLASGSWRPGALMTLGAAAGVSMLVRPTGVLYAGLWALVVLAEGGIRRVAWLVAAVAPFAVFWLWSNHVRTGSYLELGFRNSTPGWGYNMPIERFGSRCADTLPHGLLCAGRLFVGFFAYVSRQSSVPWLAQCHFDFEDRGVPLESTGRHAPFLGPVVLVASAWLVWRIRANRERPYRYLPFALVGLLFFLFARRGMGFAWRYAADFWPALLLACVQRVQSASLSASRVVPWMQGAFVYGCFRFAVLVVPAPVPDLFPVMPEAMIARRYELFGAFGESPDPVFPSRIECGDVPVPVFQNGLGWEARCSVDTFTNLAIGVPPGTGDAYRLRARTEDMTAPEVRVYVNGGIYVARKSGDDYEADVRIPYAKLRSPAVVVTVEWTRDFDPPRGKLLSVEILR